MKIFRRIMMGFMAAIVLTIGTFILVNFFLVKSEERFVNNLEFKNSEIHVTNLEEFEHIDLWKYKLFQKNKRRRQRRT